MFFGFETGEVFGLLTQLGIACVLALLVGWNRESREKRNAGLRTSSLVVIASCGYMILGIQVLSTKDAEFRVLVGVITGVGFVCGGAILKISLVRVVPRRPLANVAVHSSHEGEGWMAVTGGVVARRRATNLDLRFWIKRHIRWHSECVEWCNVTHRECFP